MCKLKLDRETKHTQQRSTRAELATTRRCLLPCQPAYRSLDALQLHGRHVCVTSNKQGLSRTKPNLNLQMFLCLASYSLPPRLLTSPHPTDVSTTANFHHRLFFLHKYCHVHSVNLLRTYVQLSRQNETDDVNVMLKT